MNNWNIQRVQKWLSQKFWPVKTLKCHFWWSQLYFFCPMMCNIWFCKLELQQKWWFCIILQLGKNNSNFDILVICLILRSFLYCFSSFSLINFTFWIYLHIFVASNIKISILDHILWHFYKKDEKKIKEWSQNKRQIRKISKLLLSFSRCKLI